MYTSSASTHGTKGTKLADLLRFFILSGNVGASEEQILKVLEWGEKPANFVPVAGVCGQRAGGHRCNERHRDKWDAIRSFYN